MNHANPMRLVLLAASALALFCGSVSAQANALQVPKDYATVQDAIAASQPGNEIIVRGGVQAGFIVVTQPDITIRGVNGAVLNGSFNVFADGVRVEGWTINAGTHQQGLQLNTCTGSSAKNNLILGGTLRGLWLLDAQDCSVKNNTMIGAAFDSIGATGNNTGTEVKNNDLAGNGYFGLYFFGGSGASITNNTVGGAHVAVAGGATGGYTFHHNTLD